MAQIKIITVFDGVSKNHDSEVTRSVISLKTMYRDNVNITIITEQKDYIQSVHGFANGLFPITISNKSFAERLDLKGSICFLFGQDNHNIKWAESVGSKVYLIPAEHISHLWFKSKVYGDILYYPKLSYMQKAMAENGLLPSCSPVIV